ncbi:killer cell lectin-like receptor 5 isoform X2 [Phyllostomus hastatus]|nr:killer cell lectin-like receptor 5 isoform X2 [Phyllostomus hastatus]
MFKIITFTEEPLHTGYTLSSLINIIAFQRSKNSTWEKKRLCSGEKCYYFSCELKTYEESRKFCKKFYTTLLKIEDEKELKFTQSQLSSKSYYSWIGLTRKGANNFGTWEDNSAPSLTSLFFITNNRQQTKVGRCVMIAARKKNVSDCSGSTYHVCGKKNAGHAT